MQPLRLERREDQRKNQSGHANLHHLCPGVVQYTTPVTLYSIVLLGQVRAFELQEVLGCPISPSRAPRCRLHGGGCSMTPNRRPPPPSPAFGCRGWRCSC